MDKVVITTRELTLGFDHEAIVRDISLTIEEGEFIGILGPNGSGKSTFLRALLGLIKPLSGEITIFAKAPKRGVMNIGYMPQIRSFISVANLTSRALLETVCDGVNYGLPFLSRHKKNDIQKILELVGAASYADRPIKQLSGGERQRIYLAQSLLGKPSILLLDEPLSNLDPKYQDIFISLLNEIRQKLNVTILLTAHDPNPLLPVINRVLFFANGKAAIGNINQIMTSQTLSMIYGTPIEVLKFHNRLFVLSETKHNILGETHHHD